MSLEFISGLLGDAGARVTEANSVRAGVAALRDGGPFDLLVTDYVLVDGTGLEVAEAARGRVGRVVLVSGELASVPVEGARAVGVVKFIPKFELTHERVGGLFKELFG